MNDWVVESPSFEEQLMNNRIVYLNQKGINEVVELINNKDKEIETLNKINKKATRHIEILLELALEQDSENVNLIDRLKGILDILKGVDKE